MMSVTNLNSNLSLPFYTTLVSAGMPSPAEPYEDAHLSLHSFLGLNHAHIISVEIHDDSLGSLSINRHDFIIIDKARKPKVFDIVYVEVEDRLICAQLIKIQGHYFLKKGSLKIKANVDQGCTIKGVVAFIIHQV